jgi:hypothetical protein
MRAASPLDGEARATEGDAASPPGATELRPMPWRTLAIFFVPFAALAAATCLQRWLEGRAPSGDALVRWLLFASLAGLLVGGITGVALGRNRLERYGWTFWGVLGPWCVTIAVTGLGLGVRSLEERWASHERNACRAAGRALCTPAEFRAACAEGASPEVATRDAAARRLGVPERRSCDPVRCRSQWSYDGPFPAEGASTRQICTIVADDHTARWMLLAGEDP